MPRREIDKMKVRHLSEPNESYMIVDRDDLTEALARLELEGGDCLEIEAKTFSEYSRAALGPTLSAFANLPGGGIILLGVSENPVSVVGVERPRDLKQALAVDRKSVV